MSIQVAVKHHTSYRYDRRVALTPHVLRLRPAPHAQNRVSGYSLKVAPQEHFINWQQDAFGNYLARLVFPEKTRELTIDVEVIVDMVAINPFDFFLDEDAQAVPFTYDATLSRDLAPYLAIEEDGEAIRQWVADFGRPEGKTIDFIVALNRRLAEDIEYTVRMEAGVQTCAQTLAKRLGSCRDTGWLLAQILRHFGLASRFVSGYLIQLVADEVPVEGPAGPSSDFTDLHAWTEVYLPGAGWVGLDPTSGLLAGEGHIPLACAPHYASAAPVEGASEKAEVSFSFANEIWRIHEDPRVTRPYTAEQWQAIDRLGRQVDDELLRHDVRLTMGGEPTFVSKLDMESPEWNIAALGDDKRRMSEALLWRLKDRYADKGLVHHGMGKWYPGEQLPRWALSLYWRRDGGAIWQDPALLANPLSPPGTAPDHAIAETFAKRLCEHLRIAPDHVIPGYEDVYYYLWREGTLPSNVDPFDAKLEDELERDRLRRVFTRGLSEVVGFALPLTPVAGGWQSGEWPLRRERMYLIPGDSPMGFRLPLPSLPYVEPGERMALMGHDPFGDAPGLPPREAMMQRAGSGGALDGAPASARSGPGMLHRAGDDRRFADTPADLLPARWSGAVATALCTEVRDSVLHVFMPPVTVTEKYLELVAAVEHTAEDLGLPVVVEGYAPPYDRRLEKLAITPDPGVVEVNVHPAASWAQLTELTDTLYEQARQVHLGTEKFMLDGRHTGTGGGNHVVLGGPTPADSPFLRRPELLKSLLSYWQNHPALSYLFAGLFIGPTSQAPRVDEARDENLYELETALALINQGADAPAPWTVDRLLRNHLTDLTGNTHRAEFCIDKLYSPDTPEGRRGLVEFRAFEMPPHAQMSAAQMLLMRCLVSRFWREPYDAELIRYGTALHDRFMLPYYTSVDFADVIAELNHWGYPLAVDWYDPFFEFRFPKLGEFSEHGMQFTLRAALEPWHVLGEQSATGGTSRYVDSSTERVEVKVEGLIPERFAVAVNGVEIPVKSTGRSGEYVGGVRYKAWDPPSAMHPTVPATQKLVFDIVDRRLKKSVGGCSYFVAHPGGLAYERFPVNAREAETRRLSRFWPQGHSQGSLNPLRVEPSAEFPYTLDLRRVT